MRITDLVKIATEAIFERRTRAILTIIGIAIGPLIVTAIMASVQGLAVSAIGLINKDVAPQVILVFPTGNQYISPYMVEVISQIPGVKEVVPFYLIPATMFTKDGPKPVTIVSANLQQLQTVLPGLGLQNGVFPSESSINEVDVGYHVWTPLYPNQPTFKTGDLITVSVIMPNGGEKSLTLIVSGELKDFSVGVGFDINRDLIASEAFGRDIYGSEYSGVFVLASSLNDVEEVANTIKQDLGSYVQVATAEEVVNFIQQQVASFNLLLLIVGSASFIVAFISILTTMLTSVVERTREIGLLLSLGFTRGQIMLTFLTEALLMGLIGGGIGTLIGYFGSYAFLSFILSSPAFNGLKAQPVIYLSEVSGILILVLLITTIAGIIPAYKASKIEPAKALRYEV